MPNRRNFILQSVTAGGAFALTAPRLAFGERKSAPASNPVRVLILGGTGFIGPYFVRSAVERGHRVSVFNRGKSHADLPPGVERLLGDRNGDLESIKKRDWDVVIDTATYGPAWVRSLGEALHNRVRHYTFISSINVYDHSGHAGGATDENSKLAEYAGDADPYSTTKLDFEQYGALKVLCEREAERQFPGRTVSLRPCYIVGPGAGAAVLIYWAARMEMGGEILAAGDPLSRIHAIDVRDLAKWSLDLAERGETGAFNAVGPESPMNWGSLLKSLRSLSSAPVKLTWVPMSWLAEHRIGSGSNLLFWPTGITAAGAKLVTNDKARAKGLDLRPLLTTATDALAWYKAQPAEQRAKMLPGVEGMSSLDESVARERSLLAAWHIDAGDA